MKRLSILSMLAVIVLGTVLLAIREPNPYKFQYEADGVAYYVFCTDHNCTLMPESDVPERFRK